MIPNPRTVLTIGFFALYNGLSASLLRQATYSTVRFGVYAELKDMYSEHGKPLSLGQLILMASASGWYVPLLGIISCPKDWRSGWKSSGCYKCANAERHVITTRTKTELQACIRRTNTNDPTRRSIILDSGPIHQYFSSCFNDRWSISKLR